MMQEHPTGRTPHDLHRSIAVELLNEREVDQGWEYDAQILWARGPDDAGANTGTDADDPSRTATRLQRIVLRLSWADYHHWSADGGAPPSQIAEAVLQLIADHATSFLGVERIDASTARRRVPDADAAIRRHLAGE
jgi:hypothetical protein